MNSSVVRELNLPKTFAQPDAKVVWLPNGPKKNWQLKTPNCGIQLAYEPREHAEGRTLVCLGELHTVDGMQCLVKYDGDTLEEIEDWFPPRDPTQWVPSTMSDREAEWLRLKCKREHMLKTCEQLRHMVNLVRRVKKGSVPAIKELVETPMADIEWFRKTADELQLNVDCQVYTTPRMIRRLGRKAGVLCAKKGV